MVQDVRSRIRDRVAAGATLDEIELMIRMSRGLTQEERDALWLYAWHCTPDLDDPYHLPPGRSVSLEPALGPLG